MHYKTGCLKSYIYIYISIYIYIWYQISNIKKQKKFKSCTRGMDNIEMKTFGNGDIVYYSCTCCNESQ